MRPPVTSVRMTNTWQAYYPTGNRRRALVIHATAGYHPSDFNWLRKGGGSIKGALKPVSVHYYIDKRGRVSQFLDEQAVAWHAGASAWAIDGKPWIDLNSCAVGIELENNNSGRDPYPAAQIAACTDLSRDIVIRNQIPRSQLVRHLDISPGRKTDPAGFPWEAFKRDVYAVAQSLASPALRRWRVIPTLPTWVPIREARNVSARIAWNGEAKVPPGYEFEGEAEAEAGFVWLADGRGFIEHDFLEAA